MAKYRFYVSTGYVGSTREEIVEIDDEEIEGMTEDEAYDFIYENYFQDWLANTCDMGLHKED